MNKKILAIMLSFLMILTLISPILAVSSPSGATIIDLSPDGNNDSTVIDMEENEDNKSNPTIIDIEDNDEESNKVDLDSERVIIDLKGNQKSGEDSHQIELPKRDEEKSQIDNNPEDKYNKILPEKEDNSKDTKSLLEEIVNKIKPKTKEASPDPKENKSVKSILEGIVSKFSKKSDNEDKIEDTNERSVSDEENLELSDESVSEPLKADGSKKPLEVVEKDPIEGSNGKFTQIIEFDSNNQDITYKINVSSKQNIKVKLVSKNENIEVDREGNISFKTDAGSYQYQTGGELIPEDTKFVTDQNSKDYTDSEGYKGTLSSYTVKIPGPKTKKTIYASWHSGCPIPGLDPGHGPSSGDTMSIDPEVGLESIVNESSIDITSFNNNTSFNNISPYDGDTSLNGCRLIEKIDKHGSQYECIYECEGKDTIKTRYKGTVTRPEKDTRTYETRYKDKIEITYKESNGLMDEEVGNGWTIGDFEYTTKNSNNYVTGFSYKGIEKLKTNKNVTISNKNLDGETVTRIDNDAFKYQGASQNADILMENVIIPNEINSIGKNAFRGQNRLKTVVANGIGKSISLEQGFKDNAFYGCSSLTDVTMDELLVVGTSAFEGCSSLVNLKADKVQYVSGGAFTNCQSIEKLNFPNLKMLGQEPFAGCIHFTEITLKDDFRVQSGDINQTFRTSSGNSPNKKKVLIKTLNRENPNNYPIEDENYKMLVRPDKPIDATGTNGGIKWTLYKDGELFFEPVNGVSGTFDDTNSKNIIGERLRRPELLVNNVLSQKVKKISSYGEINFNEDMHSSFVGFKNLENAESISNWKTDNLKNAFAMFSGCSGLTSLGGLSNWNMSNVTTTGAMFYDCSNLTSLGNLSNWDMSNVTTTQSMFEGCSNLTTLDLSKWNMSNATNTSYMFSRCSSLTRLGDLSNWDMSNVTTTWAMFYGCSNIKDISFMKNWDLGKIKYASNMFDKDINLQKLQFGSNVRLPQLTSIPVLTGEHDGKVYSGHWVNSEDSSEYYTPEEFMTAWHEQEGKPNNTMAGKIYIAKERTYEDTDLGSDWTVGDFIYSKSSLGDIVPDGNFVVGFSESGLKKIETNKNLVLPHINMKGEKVDTVGAGAFSNKGIKSVKVPDSITTLEHSAFSFNRLKEFKSDSIKTIRYGEIPDINKEFINNNGLPIPTDYGVFGGNSDLTDIELNSLETNEGPTFSYCLSLTEISLPKLISIEGGKLFYGDGKLESVNMPKLIKLGGELNFSDNGNNLPKLNEVIISDEITDFYYDNEEDCKPTLQNARTVFKTVPNGELNHNIKEHGKNYVINPVSFKVRIIDQYGNKVENQIFSEDTVEITGIENPYALLEDENGYGTLLPMRKDEYTKAKIVLSKIPEAYIQNQNYTVIGPNFGLYSLVYTPDTEGGNLMTIRFYRQGDLPMTGGRTLLIITVMGISMLGLGIKFRK